MVVEYPAQRHLVEQLLAHEGLRPEALPNLFELTVPDRDRIAVGGSVNFASRPERLSQIPGMYSDVVSDLAKWRQMFPQTIDAITQLSSLSVLPSQDDAQWLALSRMRPQVSATSDVSAIAGEPSLFQQYVDAEPAGPEAPTRRFAARLPNEGFYDPRLLNLDDWQRLHDVAITRSVGRPGLQYGGVRRPAWGDLIGADALRMRLIREHPEAYDEITRAVGLTVGPNRLGYSVKGADPTNPKWSEREVTRRLSSIYGVGPGRHAGMHINPNLYLQDDARKIKRENPSGGSRSTADILREMEKAEYKPGQIRESMDPFKRRMRVSAATARNPTNTAIQQIINRAVGMGDKQMRGAISPKMALGLGAGALALGGGALLAKQLWGDD